MTKNELISFIQLNMSDEDVVEVDIQLTEPGRTYTLPDLRTGVNYNLGPIDRVEVVEKQNLIMNVKGKYK